MLAFAIVATVPCLLVVTIPSVRAVARRERAALEAGSSGPADPMEPTELDASRADGDMELSRAS